MLKAAMFRGRVNPSGALKLVNIAQPLHPRRINQILFGNLFGIEMGGYSKGYIPVNGIGNQGGPFIKKGLAYGHHFWG
jgi:hypothetical protein